MLQPSLGKISSARRRRGYWTTFAFSIVFSGTACAAHSHSGDQRPARALDARATTIEAVRPHELDEDRFVSADLSDVANSELDWLIRPPYGDVRLGSVPFNIRAGNRAVIHTRNRSRPDYPEAVRVRIGVASVARVHLLLSGSWVSGPGQHIGRVRISYSDGSTREVALVVMQTIRETWMPIADFLKYRLSPPPDGVMWKVAYSESQMRGEKPSMGFLDRLSIATDPARTIDEISLLNEDRRTGSGIILTAVTLEKSHLEGREARLTGGPR
jgi:hypothetical protein